MIFYLHQDGSSIRTYTDAADFDTKDAKGDLSKVSYRAVTY